MQPPSPDRQPGSQDSAAFAALRARIADDLQPVEPFRPLRHILPLLTGGIAVFCLLAFLVFGLRSDHNTVGAVWIWGLTIAEIATAVGLLILVSRETYPSRNLSTELLTFAVLLTCAIHLAVCWLTHLQSPEPAPQAIAGKLRLLCIGMEVAMGLPLALVILEVCRRGLLARPWRVGLLVGLCGGLTADAVWRLFCPYSNLRHVLASHTLGIVLVVVIALGISLVRNRRRSIDANR